MAERRLDQVVKVIKRLLPGQNPSPVVQDQLNRPLLKSTDAFTPTYTLTDYLNPKALDREEAQIAELLDNAHEAVNRTQITMNSKSELNRWVGLQQSLHPYLEKLLSLNQQLGRADNEGEPLSISDVYANHILQAGAGVIVHRNLTQLASFARSRLAGNEDTFTPYFNARRSFLVGDVAVKFNGISVWDIAEKRNYEPHQIFGFVMEAILTRRFIAHDQILAQNLDIEQAAQFPNSFKVSIESGSAKVYGLNNMETNFLDEESKSRDETTKNTAIASKALMTRMKTSMTAAFDAYTKPQSVNHRSMVQTLEHYFSLGKAPRLLAANVLLGSDPNKIVAAFRSSKLQDDSWVHTELADAIYDYVSASQGSPLTTAEELDLIFPSEPQIAAEQQDLTNKMAGMTKKIGQQTSQREFSIDPEKINWDGISPAQAMSLEIDKANPTRFQANFQYENPQGETLAFYIHFDTKRERSEWSVLEDPNSSTEIRNRYIALARISYAALEQAALIAEKQALERRADRFRREALTPVAPVKKQSGYDQQHQTSKQARKENPKPQILTPIQQALQEGFAELTREDAKVVNIPTDQDFINVSGSLSSKDRDTVRAKLEEQNERGVGRFKRLRTPGANGEARYSYRIGDTRVIIQEVASKENTRHFKIVDISYRKDVYKK